MTDRTALSKIDLIFGDLESELATTRRILEIVPEEKFNWKPHEESFSLGALAFHITNILFWQKISLTEEGFDLATSPPPEKGRSLPGKDELLRTFDRNVEELREAVIETEEQNLEEPWTLCHGDHAIVTNPRAYVFRRFGTSHLIHHRGQLSLYLRMLDVPFPQIY